jgi:hypothetical protein
MSTDRNRAGRVLERNELTSIRYEKPIIESRNRYWSITRDWRRHFPSAGD